jgi:hypothetical protein
MNSIGLSAAINATVFRATTSPISAAVRDLPPSSSSYRTSFTLIATGPEDLIFLSGLSTKGVVELIEDVEWLFGNSGGVPLLVSKVSTKRSSFEREIASLCSRTNTCREIERYTPQSLILSDRLPWRDCLQRRVLSRLRTNETHFA